ncbi:MAG: cell division ATP-binding protein FtsE [Gammaproteobacteria bacterium]|nr:cell division ATP-binding protein FtsE [Gammaproteobacteria bacterium]
MSQIVHFHSVSHRYPGGGEVLADIGFRLAKGEMAFLTGRSGAGKSTLLKLIALLARPTRGQIVVNGQNLATLKRRHIPLYRQQIGIIFQNFNLLYDRTVFDNVALPLVIRGYAHEDIGRRVRAALDSVGLLHKEKAMPMTLSGGEQQRVGIARAIVTKPILLLADEPTGNLDPEMALETMEIFRRFNEVGVSVLVATHAIDLIQQLPYRVIHLDGGRISKDQPVAFAELDHE